VRNRRPISPSRGPELRLWIRRRARLKTAKILSTHIRFLTECRVHDLSAHGLCLALSRSVDLPQRFLIFDDETGGVRQARLVWRRGAMVGAKFCSVDVASPLKASDLFALGHRYYAVPNH